MTNLALLPWGKWGNGEEPSLPVLAHMLDTAGTASILWDNIFTNTNKENLVNVTKLSELDTKKWFITIAALHDLGKVDPIFQGQLLSRDKAKFSKYYTSLNEKGLEHPSEDLSLFFPKNKANEAWSRYRHENRSAEGLEPNGFQGFLCSSIGGHHGIFQESKDITSSLIYSEWLKASSWGSLQQEIKAIILEVCDSEDIPFNQIETSRRTGPIVPLISGMIVLADWLASNEEFLASAPIELLADGEDKYILYLQHREEEAKAKIEDWLGFANSPSGSFQELFNFEPSRPVQEWAVKINPPEKPIPNLNVVMVPMGEGKTETALMLHSIGQKVYGDGLLFALPTMATADAMFNRIQRFYRDTPTVARLSHGKAILNAFYSDSNAGNLNTCENEGEGLRPSNWFNGSHRALLAPVTVSTCDQVLAAAISHKYIQMRLLSLSMKHLILDEVHLYDPYQHELLCRLLGWLAFLGSRVTLLSATLPEARVKSITKAWRKGLSMREDYVLIPQEEDLISYPSITRIIGNETEHIKMKSFREVSLDISYTYVKEDTRESKVESILQVVREIFSSNPIARIGIILNTVDMAIDTAYELKNNGFINEIIHSRMTARQKNEKTDRIIKNLGRNAPAVSQIVVGTQLLESSLDIDFDFMITELPNMAALLQRSGRLWRHSEKVDRLWIHPENLQYRNSLTNPSIRVIVPFLTENKLSRKNSLPYSQAEINATWVSLNMGETKTINIPEDIQHLIDQSNITWASLSKVEEGSKDESSILGDLATNETKKRKANDIGVNVEHFDDWNDKKWRNSLLTKMTSGTLWSEEAQTRLSDLLSCSILILGSSLKNEYAYEASPEDLNKSMKIAQKKALGSVVSTNGKIAGILIKYQKENELYFDTLAKNTPTLLKGLLPLSLENLSNLGLRLDSTYGLLYEKEGS